MTEPPSDTALEVPHRSTGDVLRSAAADKAPAGVEVSLA
jgi:hypothetical protein